MVKSLLFGALLFFFANGSAFGFNGLEPLHVDGKFFKDTKGRVVVLRGYNAAGDSKVPPFEVLKAEDFDRLIPLGVNILRLVFIWEAFESERGIYNENYLSYYVSLIEAAAKRNIYTLVDFHQDGFSRYTLGGCGEGFPLWTIPEDVETFEPDNGQRCAWWSLSAVGLTDRYNTPKAWKAFYANDNNVRDSYIAMVTKVIDRLRLYPSVVGVDLLNEPYGDELNDIAPLYEQTGEALRRVAPEITIFWSATISTSDGHRSKLPKPQLKNVVFAPHLYDPGLWMTGIWLGNPRHAAFHFYNALSEKWQAPILLGEHGAPGRSFRGQAYMKHIMQKLDENFSSSTQWNYTPNWTPENFDGWNREDFSIIDDQGRLRKNHQPWPYPQSIAGEPIVLRTEIIRSQHRPFKQLFMHFEWYNHASNTETVIFWPRYIVPNDAPLHLIIKISDPNVLCQDDAPNSVIRCFSKHPGVIELDVSSDYRFFEVQQDD